MLCAVRMGWKRAFVFYWCYFAVVDSVVLRTLERTARSSNYSIEVLLNTVFPTKTSNDLDLDPCKAGKAIYFK